MVTIGKCKEFHSILQEAAARVVYKARHVSGDSNGDIATLHARMVARLRRLTCQGVNTPHKIILNRIIRNKILSLQKKMI